MEKDRRGVAFGIPHESIGTNEEGQGETAGDLCLLFHGDHTGVSREGLIEKVLFACDELTAFITAVALVRPDKSVLNLEEPSIKNRMKEKAFARTVRPHKEELRREQGKTTQRVGRISLVVGEGVL
jgi:predicted hydrolase (HD superfamily)